MDKIYIILGAICVALGAAGIFLPLLPATPFLLLAAALFAKGSPRWHGWLLAHKHFGPPILRWQKHGAISRSAKWMALLAIGTTFSISVILGLGRNLLMIQGATLSIVALFILSRPSGPEDRE